jgi:rhamnosyltransferase
VREFGGANGEGKRYVVSEIRHLWRANALLIPSGLLRNVAKFSGYWLGRREAKLSMKLRRRLSMHREFWS